MSLFDRCLSLSLSLSNLLLIYLSQTPSTLLLFHPHLPLRPRIFNIFDHLHTQAVCEMSQPQLQLLRSDLSSSSNSKIKQDQAWSHLRNLLTTIVPPILYPRSFPPSSVLLEPHSSRHLKGGARSASCSIVTITITITVTVASLT